MPSLRDLVHLAAAPLLLLGAGAPLTAQQAGDSAVINQSRDPWLASFRFRSIGPASMGGRVDDIEVAPSDPRVIYVGYATGGVFKSVNSGTSFTPVFETYGSASIGDLAVDPRDADVLYVGAGEPNNRQTSTFGDGIYKSTDGGKSFTNVGLRETQTIARIVIDPKHPDVVYVAVPGHLFGPGPDRGVYKTTDGGHTWSKVLYVDENTGVTDVAIDPGNTNVLYAASYQRRRTGCCYNGGGPGSAIWRSDNGGKTWSRLTGNGLPPGTYGRIALAVAASNPNVVYAQVETSGPAEPASEAGAGGGGGGGGGRGGFDWCNNAGPGGGFGGRGGSAASDTTRTPPALDGERSGIYRSDNGGRSWRAVSNCNPRPLYFSQIRVDPSNPDIVYTAGVRLARSLDGGRTFLSLDTGGGFFNMGEDQHAIWIDPHDGNHVLRGTDAGLNVSWDQGASWEYVRTMAVALAYWVSADLGHPYYVYAGLQDNDSWGGPSMVRSRIGIQGSDWFHLGGGDGFQTAVDPTDFHVVYAESQDGNVQRFDLRTGRSGSVRPSAPPVGRGGAGGGRGGGGGEAAGRGNEAAPAAGSCVDGRIVTAGGRGGRGGFGGRGGRQGNVVNAEPGDTYRFNWNTPILLSPHNPHIVWVGGNRLFKSYDQGESWVASADLTRQVDRCHVPVMGAAGDTEQLSKNDGVSAFSTITAVSESPVVPGVVWAGTDDGNLQVSRDGGTTFSEVGHNIHGLPAGALTGDNPYWISRIEASHFDAAMAYVAVDGHRSDDLHPYIFVTRDFGASFQPVMGDLPAYGNVQVIREDPKNRALLFVGTEFGIFTSLDGGTTWKRFMNGYPVVRTDDLLVHPRDGDLIVASHGRSLWIADDITPLEQFTPEVAAQDVALFDVRPAIAYKFDLRTDQDVGGDKRYEGENPPRGTAISYWLRSPSSAAVKVSVLDASGETLCTSTGESSAGIHRVQWTLVAPLASNAGRGGRGGSGGGGGGGSGSGRGAAPDSSCAGGGGGGGRGGSAGNAVDPGTYVVKLEVGGRSLVKTVTVLEDVWMFER